MLEKNARTWILCCLFMRLFHKFKWHTLTHTTAGTRARQVGDNIGIIVYQSVDWTMPGENFRWIEAESPNRKQKTEEEVEK